MEIELVRINKFKIVFLLIITIFLFNSGCMNNRIYLNKFYDKKASIFYYDIDNDFERKNYGVPLDLVIDSSAKFYFFSIPNSNYNLSYLNFNLSDLKNASIEIDTLFDYSRTIIEINSSSSGRNFSLWIKNNQFIYELHESIGNKNNHPKKVKVLEFDKMGNFKVESIEDFNW